MLLMSTIPLCLPTSPKPDIWWPLWVHRVDSTLVCDWVLVDMSVARRPMKSKDFLPSIYGGTTQLLVKTNSCNTELGEATSSTRPSQDPGRQPRGTRTMAIVNIASFAMGGRVSNVMEGINYSS